MTQDGFPNYLNVRIPLNTDFLLLMTPLKIVAWHLIASFTAYHKVLCVAVELQDSPWLGEFIRSVFMSCAASRKQAALRV